MSEKIIVSMTSYPKRITNAGISIYLMLTKQTLSPDEIHLWLSVEEFPGMLADLPGDLQSIVLHPKVFIHWLPNNTYVHKRHEIFKLFDNDACVFLIDDDVIYNNALIETVMQTHRKWPNSIICYNQYSKHEYSGKHIIYGKPLPETSPKANHNRWCGQSMIPASIYPHIILDPEHQLVRNRCSPISDECWIQPWLVLYDIPVYHLSYDWGKDINPALSKTKGLCSTTHTIEANGLERRDNWLHAVLTAYPSIMNKYNKLWGYK